MSGEARGQKWRNWLGTWNNPDIPTEDFLKDIYSQGKVVYLVGQLEKGKEGTVHVQFFVNFKSQKRLSEVKKLNGKAHWQGVTINNGAHNYCMKEETRLEGPYEFGIRPVQRNNKTDWDRVKQLAIDGKLNDLPSDIFVIHYANLQRIRKDHLQMNDSPDLRGVWICGRSGVGKSRKARDDYPGAYFKLANKWWDGYKGEKNVILDDFGREHSVLAYNLKIWADRYGCVLETKGGAVASNFDNFVVTSQYSIDQIWSDDETREAINRRFKSILLN
jgi:hypothetical protein